MALVSWSRDLGRHDIVRLLQANTVARQPAVAQSSASDSSLGRAQLPLARGPRVRACPAHGARGANGSGKSAILRAINLLPSHRYPTLNSLRLPCDFTGGDDSKDMIIRVRLEEPLTHVDKLSRNHEILGFELSPRSPLSDGGS